MIEETEEKREVLEDWNVLGKPRIREPLTASIPAVSRIVLSL